MGLHVEPRGPGRYHQDWAIVQIRARLVRPNWTQCHAGDNVLQALFTRAERKLNFEGLLYWLDDLLEFTAKRNTNAAQQVTDFCTEGIRSGAYHLSAGQFLVGVSVYGRRPCHLTAIKFRAGMRLQSI